MAGRLLPGTTLRVRRGRRDDVVALRAVLGEPAGPSPRGVRRVVGDLRADVYVAEDGAGTVVGVVALSYARSLFRGGMAAVLDGVRARPPAGPDAVAGLVAFAEDRARRRGCRRITACPDPADAALCAALVARGYAAGAAFSRELGA